MWNPGAASSEKCVANLQVISGTYSPTRWKVVPMGGEPMLLHGLLAAFSGYAVRMYWLSSYDKWGKHLEEDYGAVNSRA